MILKDTPSFSIQDYPFPRLNPQRLKMMECTHANMDNLLPVWRRYKGPFWESLEFWVLPPPVQKRLAERSVVMSPLLGLVHIDTPIPYAPIGWKDVCNGKRVGELWRSYIRELTKEIFSDQVVFSFLGREEEKLVDLSKAKLVVRFIYRKKGRVVTNSQPHRAFTLRYIEEKNLSPDHLEKINFYDYRVTHKELRDNVLTVILESEGRYI
ncbi:conserved hypothetical protein [Thermocrinis albus DSM 14484]|uniref:Peroxide stress protein YaaA n=2 Tax=Thermocrinis TaxID=75905 RepID=D3SM90_THEAH|nr:conserved hypothetical protein [Thermocrinis albus DSM 14484]